MGPIPLTFIIYKAVYIIANETDEKIGLVRIKVFTY